MIFFYISKNKEVPIRQGGGQELYNLKQQRKRKQKNKTKSKYIVKLLYMCTYTHIYLKKYVSKNDKFKPS